MVGPDLRAGRQNVHTVTARSEIWPYLRRGFPKSPTIDGGSLLFRHVMAAPAARIQRGGVDDEESGLDGVA